MVTAIILILIICYAFGFSPMRLIEKIGNLFLFLIGLWVIFVVIYAVLAAIR